MHLEGLKSPKVLEHHIHTQFEGYVLELAQAEGAIPVLKLQNKDGMILLCVELF